MTNKPKSTHGGARRGAGRKPSNIYRRLAWIAAPTKVAFDQVIKNSTPRQRYDAILAAIAASEMKEG